MVVNTILGYLGEKTIKTQLQTSWSLAYTFTFFSPTQPPTKHLRIYQFIHRVLIYILLSMLCKSTYLALHIFL